MRVLLQLVQSASVAIDGKEIASIDKGYLLFVGLQEGDDEARLAKMASKIYKLRIFPDENGKTNKSLSDVNGNILVVSQFTLYANAREGNRPSFVAALSPDKASPLFDKFVEEIKKLCPNAQCGVFGADMKVSLVNDGPFTLWLDSEDLFR